ncbi:MAG: TIGR04282 family arsenosugar biosynthesis glycosyltransferase [Thermoanaerobaculia bacterium]|nr:TIGR04282 family arsenosugar biosynthesis glycosyltransferase [Thermoanaerobaculia bacterium]
MSDSCVLMFTKPAVPGRVKTRLIGELSPDDAADLHQAFLSDLRRRLKEGSFALRLAWDLEADETIPPGMAPSFPQEGATLGDRLYRGLTRVVGDHAYVAAVGSDHPELPLARVETAFQWLRNGADVVLGPASDGGYYLIGTRRETLHPRLFEEIPWSTAEVLARTENRIAELGLEARLLPAGEDVDTPADLRNLADRIRREEPDDLPATTAILRRIGFLEEEVEP